MKKHLFLTRIVIVASLCGALFVTCGTALAAEDTEARITALEKELAALKDQLAGVPAAPAKPAVRASLPIEIYGFFKLDASYDTSDVFPGNFAFWVDNEDAAGAEKNDNKFNMTVNQTRVGLKIAGPEMVGAKTSALIETDFYGDLPNVENKPVWRLRRAFVKMEWPDMDLSVLGGQEWDFTSPLAPKTLNFLPLCYAGNLGYRRPQIVVAKGLPCGQGKMLLQGGVFRTIHGGGGVWDDAGEDAGYPGMAARVSYNVERPDKRNFGVGVSGHYAEEEDVAGMSRAKSWFVGLDLKMPAGDCLLFQAECFKGQNLRQFAGTMNYDVTNGDEVEGSGGWAGVEITPPSMPKVSFNLAAAIEDLDSTGNGWAAGSRTLNRAILGNVMYKLAPNVIVGLEVSKWHTNYVGDAEGDAMRFQTSLIYNF